MTLEIRLPIFSFRIKEKIPAEAEMMKTLEAAQVGQLEGTSLELFIIF